MERNEDEVASGTGSAESELSALAEERDAELDDDTLLPSIPTFQQLLQADPDEMAKKRWKRLPALIWLSARVVWAGARWRAVASAALVGLGSAGVGVQLLAANQLLQEALEVRLAGESLSPLIGDIAVLAALTALMATLTTVGHAQDSVVTELVARHVHHKIAEVTSSVPMITFEDSEFFNLLMRATQSGSMRPRMIIQAAVQLIGALLGGLGAVAALLAVEPTLALVALIAAVPVLVATMKSSERRFLMFVDNTPDERERSTLRSLLTGRESAKETRVFNLVDYLAVRVDQVSDRILARVKSEARGNAARTLAGRAGSGIGKGLGYVLLLVLVAGDNIGLAAAMTAVLALQRLNAFIASSFTYVAMLHESALFLTDFTRLLEMAEPHRHRTSGVEAAEVVQPFEVLRAHGVSFSYPGKPTPVLDNVDLEIRRGEVIALVGENGSGKTTLAKLLCTLYQPTTGTITWDGQDLAQLHEAAVRQHLTVIFQDFVRYALPARENIGLGRHEQLDDQHALREAADIAGVARLFDKLPSGWDTVLSRMFAGGQELSGGQWQRVALARAFFRDAAFIVLDEPTAALDARAEHRLFQRLHNLAEGRTVLLITHRFANVRMADRIYVLHHGQVEEHGTHDQLMANNGRYAELFALQAEALLRPAATADGEAAHPRPTASTAPPTA